MSWFNSSSRHSRLDDDDTTLSIGKGETARISIIADAPPQRRAPTPRMSTVPTPTYGTLRSSAASEAASPSLTRLATGRYAPSAVQDALAPSSVKALISDYSSLQLNADADEDESLLSTQGGRTLWARCNARKLSWQVKAGIGMFALMALLAIVGSIGFYVIAPEYVRQRMEATSLTFAKMTLTNPSNATNADGSVSYGLTIVAQAVLSGLTPVDGTLSPMDTTLYFNGAAVAVLTLPRIHALANQDNIIGLSTPVRVVDMAAFTAFGQAVLLQNSVTFVLDGSATVSTTLAGITYSLSGIPFRKTITVLGAGGLTQNQVLSFSLSGSNPTAAIAQLTVALYNPSIASITPLGDLAISVTYKGVYMGTVLCPNASLLTGNNTLVLTGQLTPADTTAANELISAYLGGHAVAVTAQGAAWPSSTPLYAPLLPFVCLNTSLQGATTPLVNSIVVNSMFLVPYSANSVRIDLNATVVVNNPLGAASPLNVRSVAMNVSLEGGGAILGALLVPPTPVTMLPVLTGLGDDPGLATANISIAVSAILSIAETAPAFGDFILLFLNSDAVQLGLISDNDYGMVVALDSALGNLTVHIPLTARTSVPGFAGFPSVTVDSFNVAGVTENPPAVVVDLQVSILNPSPASFPLGENTTLGIYVDGLRLGGSTAVNVTLVPGMNTLNLTGSISPPPSALAATSALFTNYLKGIAGAATVIGESVYVSDSLPTPPWLQDAVTNISLVASLPGASNLTLFAEVDLQALSFNFSVPDGAAPLVAGIVGGNLHMPFSIPVDVISIDTALIFTDYDTGVSMAGVSPFNQRATYTPVSANNPVVQLEDGNAPIVGQIAVYLDASPITIYNASLFSAFIKRVLNSPSAPLLLRGTASPLVELVIGNITVSNVTIDQLIIVPGMNGLSSPPVVVTSVDITNTTATTASLRVGLNITNPSILTGDLGPSALDLYYRDLALATTTIPRLLVEPGVNSLTAYGIFTLPDQNLQPALYDASLDFLARYLEGFNSEVRLLGTPTSSPYPLLQPAFNSLNVTALFPGITTPIIQNGTLYVSLAMGVVPFANATLFVNNPLSADIQLVNASLTVWMCQNESSTQECLSPDYGPAIGFFYDGDLSKDPINVPAHSTVRTKPYNTTLLATAGDDFTLFLQVAFDGAATSKVNGTLTARIGDLQATVNYTQSRVPLTIQDPPPPLY